MTVTARIAAACAIAPRLSDYADEYTNLADMLSWYRGQELSSWMHPTLVVYWREKIESQEKQIAELQAKYTDVLTWIDGIRAEQEPANAR